MQESKSVTAAFSGYRPEKMRLSGAGDAAGARIAGLVGGAVEKMYAQGYRRFISGMARGFDLWAAREALRLRAEGVCPDLRLVAAVPFAAQAAAYDRYWAGLHREILRSADRVETLASVYDRDCFRRRNDWMIDRASALICYYTGLGGGTGYTVARARKAGLSVVNLAALDPAAGLSFP